MSTHDATFYVQIKPDWLMYYGTADPTLRGIKAAGIAQKRPTRPQSGAITVKLTVRIPDAVFLPLRPEAVIEIPASMAVVNPVEVTVEDAAE